MLPQHDFHAPCNDRTAELVDSVFFVRKEEDEFRRVFLLELKRIYSAKAVTLWSNDSVNSRLIIKDSAGFPTGAFAEMPYIEHRNSMSGLTAESRYPIFFNRPTEFDRDAHPELTKALGVKSIISIPALNQSNRNQVLGVINLSLDRDFGEFDEREFAEVGDIFASNYERLIREKCLRCSRLLTSNLMVLVSRSPQLTTHGRMLSECIASSTESDTAIIFVDQKEQFRERGFPIQSIGVVQLYYEKLKRQAENTVSNDRERILLPTDPIDGIPNEQTCSVLSVPIRNYHGKSIGAVVCLKKVKNPPDLFSWEDVTVCEALIESFVPFYELLARLDFQIAEIEKIDHEIKGPVTGMLAAVTFFRRSGADPKLQSQFLGDISGYVDSLRNILKSCQSFIEDNFKETSEPETVNWVHDLVAPATTAIETTMSERGISNYSITRGNLKNAPEMTLVKPEMVQVVFNLLENAVKYSKPQDPIVKVMITYRRNGDMHEISFRDFGIGVPVEYEDRIFSLGTRAPNAAAQSDGKGFGLAVAQRILRSHGGFLRLAQHSDGSEFIISLPHSVVDYGT